MIFGVHLHLQRRCKCRDPKLLVSVQAKEPRPYFDRFNTRLNQRTITYFERN
jgi:hypothetical protein